jgi:hypothetical protein
MENARRAAGLKRPPKRWSREILVETIQDLHVRGEVKITAPWRRDRALALAAKDYFGNWANALVAAGILREDEKPQPKPSWTKQSVIQAICERHRRGLPLTNMRNLDPSLNHAAIKYFGGWCNAVLAAGIEPEAKRHWTREGVVRAIQDRARTGLPINSIWIESLGLYYGARKHFGCWKEAIKAAGVSNVRRCHGKEEMVAKARAR